MTQETDILVIGAGPAGSVGAAILNKQGFKVRVLEKQKFPRFVIGESLLPRCMDNLEKAGFIEAIEKAGFQKKFGALFVDVNRTCEFDFSQQFTKGWTWTWQAPRADFDKVLADEAARQGVQIDYECSVTKVNLLGKHSVMVGYQDIAGKEHLIKAKFIMDASGWGRVLPRLLNLEKPADFPERVSLFCHLQPSKLPEGRERNQITIIVHGKGLWAWAIPFSNGRTSIGIVGEARRMSKHTGTHEDQISAWIKEIPALNARFSDAEIIFGPKSITGYSASVSRHFGDSYVLTGNASEFVDPIFSSGTTFATESSALAAGLIGRELRGESVDWQKEYSDYILSGVDVFKSFINHWYDGSLPKIFFSEQGSDELRQQFCSVLAGYAWDEKNPVVRRSERMLTSISNFLDVQ